jgi:hypothetical protein
MAVAEEWLGQVRDDTCHRFLLGRGGGADEADAAASSPTSSELLGELLSRLDWAIPEQDLAFVVQSGSFMYNLGIAGSDEDYSAVFISPTRALLDDFNAPGTYFEKKVVATMGSDKEGEIEYVASLAVRNVAPLVVRNVAPLAGQPESKTLDFSLLRSGFRFGFRFVTQCKVTVRALVQ